MLTLAVLWFNITVTRNRDVPEEEIEWHMNGLRKR